MAFKEKIKGLPIRLPHIILTDNILSKYMLFVNGENKKLQMVLPFSFTLLGTFSPSAVRVYKNIYETVTFFKKMSHSRLETKLVWY
jgi:hypothetical protein